MRQPERGSAGAQRYQEAPAGHPLAGPAPGAWCGSAIAGQIRPRRAAQTTASIGVVTPSRSQIVRVRLRTVRSDVSRRRATASSDSPRASSARSATSSSDRSGRGTLTTPTCRPPSGHTRSSWNSTSSSSRHRPQVGHPMPGAERPVVPDTGWRSTRRSTRPGRSRSRPGRWCCRSGAAGPATTCPSEATNVNVPSRVLADAERGHRAVLDVELDRDAPAALAVVDAEAAQQRLALADRQVGRAVVAHLDHAVAEVQGLQLGERAAGAEPVDDQHRQRRAQLVLAGRRDARARSAARRRGSCPAPSRSCISPSSPRW